MIKAILFDIDGVLLDSFEANLKFYQDLMEKAGYKSPARKEFSKISHLSLMDTIRVLTKSNSKKEMERIWKMGKRRDIAYPIELLTIPKGSKEIIEELSKKYFLGIVTSRIKNGVYEAPVLAKLKKYFKVVVSYEDTINHKPNPDPLLFASEKLGIDSRNCVYIGDVENDLIAGKAAGMKVIIYAKQKILEADAQTFSFTNLPSIIEGL